MVDLKRGRPLLPEPDSGSEQHSADATVMQCERQLQQAREAVRCAGEVLRRAIRTEKSADGELMDAEQRRHRMASQATRAR